MAVRYDFSGYATRNNVQCADGRTIRKNAFEQCDGITVPLVWQHSHGKPGDVLGHAVLENREDGVYTYGSFNNTESGRNAKELVNHGDVRALSIYANQLVQRGRDVLHGMIREVSLCLAGANPGAYIEDLACVHGDMDDDDTLELEAQIYNGENIELYHSDDSEEDESVNDNEMNYQDVFESMDDDQKEFVYYMVDKALAHSDMDDESDDEEFDSDELQEVLDTFDDDQREALEYLVEQALQHSAMDDDSDDYDEYEDDEDYDDEEEYEDDEDYDDEDYDDSNEEYDDYDEEDDSEMKHNAFENNAQAYAADAELMHDAINTVVEDGQKFGSLRESYNFHMEEGALAHAIDTTGMTVPELTNVQYNTQYGYGINAPEMLFPEPHNLNNPPEFIKRDTTWVDVVWNGVHRVPWSRIKSTFANITEDEARAKGYIKGNMKKEEFFSILKRVTVPQTVYKKQKLDRDDIVDITDFDVVRWIRSEMRIMWDEETARAMLIGDGRPGTDPDKISAEHIRPIALDVPLFSIQKVVERGANESATAKNFMKAAIRARKDYKGSGNPMLFTTEDVLTSMLLIEDGIGHYIYKSEAELATALRVSKIVTVPVMENYVMPESMTAVKGNELMGIIVNLTDYFVGTDKGGEVSLFDDFDIDYNQFKYLIESRCSGALTKPYSAIVLTVPAAAQQNNEDGND